MNRILRLLERAYGKRPWKRWGDPVSILVETILSQNTSDVNSSAGYRQLRRRFRSWEAVASAPVAEIEQCIRVSGLSRIKAPRIGEILRRIGDGCPSQVAPGADARTGCHGCAVQQPCGTRTLRTTAAHGAAVAPDSRPSGRGRISLDFLGRMDPAAATAYLRGFKGVGPKTAACTLLFSLKMPVFPVDTHILRIAKRLGLLPARAPAEKAQAKLTPLIAPANRYATHVLLIEHGRKTCRARSPRCEWCPLLPLCPFGKKRLRARRDPNPPQMPFARRHARDRMLDSRGG